MAFWTVHIDGGPRRVNHAAIAYGGRIFSFGGYCTGEDYETTRPMDVHVFSTVLYRWKSLPVPKSTDSQYKQCPYQRYGHTAVCYGECAFIWGGRNDKDGACNILFCFDTYSCTWSIPDVCDPLPGARDGHSACVVGNKMFIFGGYEEQVDKFSNEIYSFDFTAMTWSFVKTYGTPPRWRDFHSASVIGDLMYVFGGRSDRGGHIHTNNEIYCNKIKVFNTRTSEWFSPPTSGEAPKGRRSHAAFVHGGQLYLFGGYNGLCDQHFNDIFRFDPEHNVWSQLKPRGEPPCPRRRQCCCLVADRVFLFGGTSPNTETASEMEYELTDHSDLHVLDMAPSLRILCLMVVNEYGLDQSCLPKDLRCELSSMKLKGAISRAYSHIG